MQNKPRLIVDASCEIIDLLRPWVIADFWDFGRQSIYDDYIYIIGRQQLKEHAQKVRDCITQGVRIVFANPFEGSATLVNHLRLYGVDDLARSGSLSIIGGGDMDPIYDCLQFDHFLPKLHDYKENHEACVRGEEIFTKIDKPHSFLFLNGRGRAHRKYLVEKMSLQNLLDNALWTWLDPNAVGTRDLRYLDIVIDGQDLMDRQRPVKLLPEKYEVDRYRNNIENLAQDGFVKYDLFGREWGEIYINAEPYIDTYFSLVTETVFESPYSFRTEKIWKPIVIGHPWICAANRGFYRDMHNLGFRTFGHLIDESFDIIDDHATRMDRIIDSVREICQGDPADFLKAAEEVCKYNQQHYVEVRKQVLREFPDRFLSWINPNG